jgi:hypothetical protein
MRGDAREEDGSGAPRRTTKGLGLTIAPAVLARTRGDRVAMDRPAFLTTAAGSLLAAPKSQGTALGVDQDLEAAADHALVVEGHRLRIHHPGGVF